MAQDVTGITVEIRGDKAAADARRLDSSLDRLGRTGTKTEGSFERLERKSISVGRGFDALRRRSFGLQSAFRGLSGVATGLGVVLTFRELTSTITLFEKLEGSLITATGSAFEASRAFDELEQFAANTPTSLDQVVGAFIKLKNFGLDPSEEALRSYGNTAAALGKDLNQMIEAVADATNFEMERLREFGIVARQQGQEVAFTFQGVTTVVGRNAAEIEGYLRKIGDVNFAGAMEDQMNRLPGLFSNLGDSVARLFREIGEAGATDILAAGLRQAINVVNSLADNVDVAFIKIQANFELFQRSVNNILAEFGTSIEDIGPKVETLATKFLEFGSDVIDVLTNLPAYVEGFVKVAKADFNILKAEIIGGFLKIEQGARLAWENISFAASSAWEKIKSSFFDALSEMGDKLATFSELAIQALPVLPGFNLALGPAVSMAAEALRGLGDSSDTAQSKLSQLEAQHNKNVSAIQGHIDAINEVKEETINAAQAEIAAAREGLQASLNARDKRIDSLMREKENMELLDDRAAGVLKTMEKNTKVVQENAVVTETAATATKSFADTFKSLREQLDPVVRAEREFQENTALLNRALKEGKVSLEEYNKLLGLILENYNDIAGGGEKVAKGIDKASRSAKTFAEEADPVAQVWEDAASRISNTFTDTFRGILDDGIDGFKDLGSRVLGIFKDILAQMATLAIARPIIVPIVSAMGGVMGVGRQAQAGIINQLGGFGGFGGFGAGPTTVGANPISPMAAGAGYPGGGAAVAGPFSSFGSVAFSGLQGAGVGYLSSSLTGGNSIGGSIGGAIGGIAGSAFGPIGTIVGGAIGGALGGAIGNMFSSNDFKASIGTAINRSSPALRGTASDVIRESAFGNVGFAQSRDFSSRDAQEFIDSIVEIDNVLAASLLPEQIDKVRRALDGFVGSVRKGTGNIDQVKERLNVIFRAIDADAARMAQSFAGLPIDQMIEGFISLNQVSQFLKADPFADFTESLLIGSRTLYQQALISRRELIDLARSFDGSLDAAHELAAATQSRYQLELALLQQIDSVARGISVSFADTREQIIQSTLSQEQLYDRLSTRAEELARQMRTAIDPQIIGELAAQINQLTGRAFGLLDEEQKQSSAGGFLDFLSGVERLAGSRLDASRQTIEVDRNAGLSGTVASELSRVINGFSAQQQRLMNLQEMAAIAQREAAVAARLAAEAQARAALDRSNFYSGMGGR